MRICLVSPYDYLHPGGVSEHIRHLAQEYRALGHDATVMAPSSTVGDDHGIEGFIRVGRSVPIRSNGSVARISLSFHLTRRIRTLLRADPFDIVHIHEPLIPALPITVLRFSPSVTVGTFHAEAKRNMAYYYGRPFLSRYIRRLDACIAVSEPAERFVSKYFPGPYRIVPNGIETRRFHPNQPRIDHGPPGCKTLLFVGRLEKRKGASTLVAAYAMIRALRDDVRLVIVGDGPERSSLEDTVRSSGIPDVAFAGRVSDEELPRYYASADIYCSPATGGESFGIVILEAMASGTPVVASAIPGFSAIVTAGSDGLLVPPKDSAAWAKTLSSLLDNDGLRASLARGGLETAKSYDWSRVARQILDVYDDARKSSVRAGMAHVH